MAGKAEYRSAIRSRRLIRQAFLTLLEEKDYTRITVTDIVKLADLNRATFYAHYPDVRGLMEEIENEIISKMQQTLESIEYRTFFQDPAPVLLETGRWLEENADFYRVLIRANGADPFLQKLKALFTDYMLQTPQLPDAIRTSTAFRLRVCYFAGGIVNLYRQWLLGQLDCTLAEIAQELAEMMTAIAEKKPMHSF